MISSSTINNFFDFEKPCPSEIRKCLKLRSDYKKEISKLSACTDCSLRLVKNVFIDKIIRENKC
jgi:hypothetical protein